MLLRMRLALLLFVPLLLLSQEPKSYNCGKTKSPLNIDGKLNDPAWQTRHGPKISSTSKARRSLHPRFRTRAKMLWDDNYLYIGAQLDEPHVWATLTEHDSVIFHDNDFEVFIDPDGDALNYYEFEINALNTGWDLLLDKPYRLGGKANNAWNIPGLKTAVFVNGTLNKGNDVDEGWSVEIAIPWKVLAEYSKQAAPPNPNDTWRINFSRVEWQTEIVDGKYKKLPNTKEDNWVWTPQGVVNMHIPERWGKVRFTN